MSPNGKKHRQQRSENESFSAKAPDDSTPFGKALLMRLVSVVNVVVRFFSSMLNVLMVFAPVGMAVRKSTIGYYSVVR